MQRWTQSAAGGINQRLNPGFAIVRSRSRKLMVVVLRSARSLPSRRPATSGEPPEVQERSRRGRGSLNRVTFGPLGRRSYRCSERRAGTKNLPQVEDSTNNRRCRCTKVTCDVLFRVSDQVGTSCGLVTF